MKRTDEKFLKIVKEEIKKLQTNKKNSVILVRKRTIPTERTPFVGEV
jgi:hypothetical protein